MRPEPINILFTAPNGTPCQQPCLLGVIPGKMVLSDAINIIKTHPFSRNFSTLRDSQVLQYVSPDGSIYIYLDADKTSVSLVTVQFSEKQRPLYVESDALILTIGDVVAHFGPPKSIFDGYVMVCLRYEDQLINVCHKPQMTSNKRYSTASTRLTTIVLQRTDRYFVYLGPQRVDGWLGFTYAERYGVPFGNQ